MGTPFTWSIIHAFARRGFESAFGALGLDVPKGFELVASFWGRVYLNISEFVTVASQIPLLKAETLARLGGVLDTEGLEGTYERLQHGPFLRRLPKTSISLAINQLRQPLVARRWSRQFRRIRDRFFQKDLGILDRGQLLEQLDEVDGVFNRTGEVMLQSASNFLMSYVLVSEGLLRLGGSEAARAITQLFGGLTGVRSAAPGLELMELARRVQQGDELRALFLDPQLQSHQALEQALRGLPAGRAFLRDLAAFLRQWGHRAPEEAEIATPRWREDPSFLFAVIRRHLESPRIPKARSIERRQAELRQESTQLVRQHFWPGVGVVIRLLLAWSRENARLREALRADVVETLDMYRYLMLEVGRRLLQEHKLAELEDLFFLSYEELRAWLEGGHSGASFRSLVAYRRALHQTFDACPAPPDTFVLVHDRTAPMASPRPASQSRVLRGLPGAAGVVEGRARVLHQLRDELPLEPGEILVTPHTDVGWTPLFLVAAAVVTDRGGPLSHSCVVAREYGIPAVVGVSEATAVIESGDLIRVDGFAGSVEIIASRGGGS